MSKAERMRMCLAEAGFIEGRDYATISSLDSGGYIIWYLDNECPPALRAAIDKASELAGGPFYPSARAQPYRGQFTCGDPKERRAV